MYGTEVDKIRDSHVKGSFGIVIISMFLEIVIPILIKLDKNNRFPSDGALKEIKRQLRQVGIPTTSASHSQKHERTSERNNIEDGDLDRHKIRKLSAAELSKRFPPYEFDNLEYAPSVSMRTSATSVTCGKTNSYGSAHSLQTQSTMVTRVSYDPKHSDMSSLESLV